MIQQLSASAQKVQHALRARGYDYTVLESDHVTRTAADAAAVVGCTVGQIAKSLIFKAADSGRGVLVITSGANRVDEPTVATALGEAIMRADPVFVREQTGYAIGGIPPLGHAQPLVVFIDRDLLGYELVWAAGGTPNALFQLDPRDLPPMTNGTVIRVTKEEE
jgi:prolyl-tRNA editing enzyme YbaK/EbsC (Cys-tRNA(Pro) deacylase)